jgi:hypothetical protein
MLRSTDCRRAREADGHAREGTISQPASSKLQRVTLKVEVQARGNKVCALTKGWLVMTSSPNLSSPRNFWRRSGKLRRETPDGSNLKMDARKALLGASPSVSEECRGNAVKAALKFAEAHSQLFKSHREDDPSSDIISCFPPEDHLPRATALDAIVTLHSLHKELTDPAQVDPFRIFRVRDRALWRSLENSRTQQLEAMATIADYLGLPKALSQAIEDDRAVIYAVAHYKASVATYNLNTATEPKPRLFDFLESDAGTSRLVKETLRAVDDGEYQYITKVLRQTVWTRGDREEDYEEVQGDGREEGYCPGGMMHTAFKDGLTGESLSEYGYSPSPQRVCVYASACVLMGISIPLLPAAPMREFLPIGQGNHTTGRMAAALGNVELLKELHSRGWDVSQDTFALADCAARRGHLAVLQWAATVTPFSINKAARIYEWAAIAGKVQIVEWLLDKTGFDEHVAECDSSGKYLAYLAQHGAFSLVHKLHALGVPLQPSVLASASLHANKNMFLWALANGCQGSTETAHLFSLGAGHWDFFLWLLSQGYYSASSSEGALAACCRGFKGDVTKLEMLIAMGVTATLTELTYLARFASGEGHVTALKWALAQPSLQHTDKKTIENLLVDCFSRSLGEGGSTDCLRLLLEAMDCIPWPLPNLSRLFQSAVKMGCPTAIMAFLLPFFDTHREDKDEQLAKCFEIAIEARNPQACLWLHNKIGAQVPLTTADNVVPELIGEGERSLPLLRCLVEECHLPLRQVYEQHAGGCFRDVRNYAAVCEAAASSGSAKVLDYCLRQGCLFEPGCLAVAAFNNQVPMLRYLRKLRPSWPWPPHLLSRCKQHGGDEGAAWAREHGAKEEDEEEGEAVDSGEEEEDDWEDIHHESQVDHHESGR